MCDGVCSGCVIVCWGCVMVCNGVLGELCVCVCESELTSKKNSLSL